MEKSIHHSVEGMKETPMDTSTAVCHVVLFFQPSVFVTGMMAAVAIQTK